jgi:DNA-binding CsgD family transcriptional regulator
VKSALTPKQHRYLLDAARGLSAKRSANLWGVSTNTVQQALNRARATLGADNIVHAVAIAIAESEITIFEIFPEGN